MKTASGAGAYVLLVSACILSCTSLGLFGLFLWRGPFPVTRLNLTTSELMGFDGLLAILFFLQHSVMLRRSFRARLKRALPDHYQPALYAVASGAMLLLIPLLWQPVRLNLLSLHGPGRWLARGAFFAGLAGMLWGFGSLRHFDPLGGGPLLARLRSEPAPAPRLVIWGAYRWVRHPIYASFLLMIWASPDLTADRLLFNLLWTVWMVVGTLLEERDLAADFGDAYRKYQRSVPMLLPRSLGPPGQGRPAY
ncbi:MAG TPA: isoprenylcysteine carboxylmethyltransferase family protein [Terriglobia bacterium]|nr:isoprenylcysteine carboxylmethyltransferase family protein [Terriglobia bacterium]